MRKRLICSQEDDEIIGQESGLTSNLRCRDRVEVA